MGLLANPPGFAVAFRFKPSPNFVAKHLRGFPTRWELISSHLHSTLHSPLDAVPLDAAGDDVLRVAFIFIFPIFAVAASYTGLSPVWLLWSLHWRCGPNWISLGKYTSMINHLTKDGQDGRKNRRKDTARTSRSRSRHQGPPQSFLFNSFTAS